MAGGVRAVAARRRCPTRSCALWLKLLGQGVLERRPPPAGRLRRSASARRRRPPGSCARSARACSGASATRSRSRSSRTWPGCRRRSRRSRTRSGPSTSTGSSVLRDQVFVLDHMYMSLFSTCGWILRLGVDGRRCWCRSTRRSSLLAAFALPTVLTSTWRPAVERAAEERGAPAGRLARHLFATATTAPPGKEVRVTGIGDAARPASGARRGSAGTGPWPRPAGASAVWHTLAWAVFGARLRRRDRLRVVRARARRPATCCWCSPPARGCRPTSAPRSARSASCAASGWTARAAWPGSRTTPRRSWPPADAARARAAARGHPPRARVVRLPRHRPPGARRRRPRPARRRRSSRVVGENGAGKTTLVKLLCQAVRADGRPRSSSTARRSPACRPTSGARAWPARSRTSSASSFPPATSVGVGDVPRLDDEPAVAAAVDRAGAERRRRAAARRASTPSSGRPGPAASRCRSASGRSWRWPAASCATSRCCWCSTSRPPRSTPRPSTRCSSATPRRRARAPADGGPHHDPRVAPLHHRAHGRPHRRARRRPRGRGRHPRGADGDGRPVRRALRHPGRRLPLRLRRACGLGALDVAQVQVERTDMWSRMTASKAPTPRLRAAVSPPGGRAPSPRAATTRRR